MISDVTTEPRSSWGVFAMTRFHSTVPLKSADESLLRKLPLLIMSIINLDLVTEGKRTLVLFIFSLVGTHSPCEIPLAFSSIIKEISSFARVRYRALIHMFF